MISKNNILYSFASEKMTAVHHSDGIGIWLISHEMRSDKFMIYLITESGLDTSPIINGIGGILSNPNMALGQMKAAPDGSKVAMVTLYPSEIHILDFDNTSGILSNPKIIDAVSLKGTSLYGLEFSPDSKLLYVARHDVDYLNNPGYLYQLDLSLTSSDDILNSATIVGSNIPLTDLRGLQMTNDGRIMVCKNLSEYYGIIHEPNKKGVACRYEDHALLTGKFSSYWTFPNFISSFFSKTYNSEVNARFEIINQACINETISIQNKSVKASQYLWDFGNGDYSKERIPMYQFKDTGNFLVNLIVQNEFCCSDTTAQIVEINNCNENIFIPNSFSPNGDNINDYLEIFGSAISQFTIHIFDRWGNLVFENYQKQPEMRMNQVWNGRKGNQLCLPGVYVYVIEAIFESANKKTISGSLNLIR